MCAGISTCLLAVIPVVARIRKRQLRPSNWRCLDELGIDLVCTRALHADSVARIRGALAGTISSTSTTRSSPAFRRRSTLPANRHNNAAVKVIGATAHYVTAELDQGPMLIEQDVCRVSHRDTVEDMMRKGRELERLVLTRAVRLHLQRRGPGLWQPHHRVWLTRDASVNDNLFIGLCGFAGRKEIPMKICWSLCSQCETRGN